jgi:N-acetyl-anhydromuramyl-L-alanine amidase AmpD
VYWTNNSDRWNSYDLSRPEGRIFYDACAQHIIDSWEEEMNGPVPSWMIDLQGALPIHPSKRYPYRPVAGIENIVVHHVGMEFDPVAPNVQEVARRTAAYHINHRDWPGIAYTYVISKSGDVAKCWPHNVHTYHVKGHNPESIGILMEGALHLNDPTPEQVASLWQLAEWLRGELGLERINVVGHGDLTSTQCPGFQWFDGWQEAYLGDTQSELDRLRALVVERDHQITDMRETMEQARLLLERWG